MRPRPASMLVAAVLMILAAAPAVASDGGNTPEGLEEGYGLPSFNESQGCGEPSTSNPLATAMGWLGDAELIRGYKGGFYGRSIGAVRDQLVEWVVPMSGGKVVLVHERALPAFQRVTANLAAEQANGNYYTVRPEHTFGFAPRTVGGKFGFSNHAFGTAVDINSTTNPYSAANVLITDMPGWYVAAWKEAGFCWGGEWVDIKDPMHFSWKGPAATPEYGEVPAAQPTATTATGFGTRVASYPLPFGSLDPEGRYVIADATGNGLADVFQVTEKSFGTQVDWSRTNRRHDWCAVDRAAILDVDLEGRDVLLGDYERNGRLDLWLLDRSGPIVDIEIVLRSSEFETTADVATAVPVEPDDIYLLGDHDGDGRVDLFVVRRTADSTDIEVWNGADGFQTVLADVATVLGDTRSAHFAIGDRDLDDSPDLYVLDGSGLRILLNGFDGDVQTPAAPLAADVWEVAVNDFDGDGRDDLWVLHEDGVLDIYRGNTALAGASLTSWFVAANWTCDANEPLYDYEGLFRDDEGNVHEDAIDELGGRGITRGCNPPFNDEFCPDRPITRGEMAALLDRALGLPETTTNFFVDDGDSIFEANINRLAAAGITLGCNPPDNDRFCPGTQVTRGQMAAFLVRGFDLVAGEGSNRFVDDDDSVFEDDIDRLAAAGVTLGCNPPANDRYCPVSNVTRAQMASFIIRAIGTQAS